MPLTQRRPLTRSAFTSFRRIDLSPQAGRGKDALEFSPYSIGATIFGCLSTEASSFFGSILLSV